MGGALRVEGELQAVTAVHDVEHSVGLGDVFEVEATTVHVVEAVGVSAPDGDVDHLESDVRCDDLTGFDERRHRDRHRAGTACELEDAVAGRRRRSPDHPLGDLLATRVDEVGVLGPGLRDGGPHAVHVGPDVRRLIAHFVTPFEY